MQYALTYPFFCKQKVKNRIRFLNQRRVIQYVAVIV